MQLSSLPGKEILSPTGEALGYIVAARPTKDLSRLACLVAADGEEEEFFIPARAVLSMDDAVIAGKARMSAPTGTESPIGKAIFSYSGEYLGTVCDLLFGDGSEAILVVTKEGVRTTAAAECAILGEHTVLYLDKQSRDAAARSGAARKSAAPRTTHREKRESAPVPSAPAAPSEAKGPAEEISAAQTKNETPMSAEVPSKPQSVQLMSRTDLLGRIVKKSVFDDRGEPVALAGERITPAHLARARLAGRLLALSVNTITLLR